MSAEQFKVYFLTRLRELIVRAKASMERSEKHTYMHHDRMAQPPPNVYVGDQVFVMRAPSYTLSPEERFNDTRRSKLLPKSTGRFRATAVRGDVITID